MLSAEHLSLPVEQLHILQDQEPESGAEKVVYKMQHAKNVIAAKIFHEEDMGGNPIDAEQRAKTELQAYTLLRQTSLAKRIPEPHFLLKNSEKKVVGLGVEWREGIVLDALYDDRARWQGVISSILDTLEHELEQLKGTDILPEADMFDSANIAITEDPNDFWFTECAVAIEPEEKAQYGERVNKTLQHLRRTFLIDS